MNAPKLSVRVATPSLRAAALWFLLALAAGILFAHAARPGIAPASDLWDYSQEARQLARGAGFTSLYTYPVFLGHDEAPFPVRWRMPLYAVLGALLLKLGIALPMGFLYLGALAHAFLVALTYWLCAGISSPRAASWAAACALACPLMLDFYNPGMSQAPAAVFDLCVWLLLLGSGGAAAAGVAGVAAAGAWYLRGESLLFGPIWLWIAARPRPGAAAPRWSRAAVFAGVYGVLCLPWFLASHRGGGTIQGNPMLLYTAQYPGYSSSRMLGATLPGMVEYVTRHPGAFALRVAKDIVEYVLDLFDGIGSVALGIAIAGIAVGGLRQSAALIRRHAPFLAAIALQILAMSTLERSPRFLVPVLPLVFVLIGAAAEPALARLAHNRALVALILVVILERGVRVVYQHGDALRRFPPVAGSTAGALTERARGWPHGGLVLSDAPDWIAWHLDRPALFLPLRSQIDSLTAARPVAAIWLSPEGRQRNVADGDTAWVRAIDGGEGVPGFAGPEAGSDRSQIYVRAGRTMP